MKILGRALPVTLLVVGSLVAAPQAFAAGPPATPLTDPPGAVSWGDNATGQIGDATILERDTPVVSDGGSALDGKKVTQVSAGTSSSCAIAEGSLYCWGANNKGQLGIGNASPIPSPSPVLVGAPLAGKFVTQVSVGQDYACAVAVGKAYCWGNNSSGQLGDGSKTSHTVPTAVFTSAVLSGKKISAISAGTRHTCAIAQGRDFCWGENNDGELGNSNFDTDDQLFAIPVNSTGLIKNIIIDSIAVGDNHSCATGGGHAYCWGLNSDGQLGTGDNSQSQNPRAVVTSGILSGKVVFALSAGGATTCALIGFSATRSAYCWGDNSVAQVGDNTQTDRNSPVKVTLTGNPSSISVNAGGGCAVVDGTTNCWGANAHGRIGNGTTTLAKHPEKVDQSGILADRREMHVSAGTGHTSALAVTTPQFGDAAQGVTFYDDIEWVAGTGISTGYADHTYHRLDNIERQAMAAFLFRSVNPGAKDLTCAGDETNRLFDDVHTGDLFCGDIEWLVDQGITDVPASGLFAPVGDTTRSVLAAWLFRTEHPDTGSKPCAGNVFNDVSDTGPHKSLQCGNIEWLAAAGVTIGYDDGGFHPNDPIRRDAMAAFLHRADSLTSH
ncbi:hypothetical protein D1871_14335 [Nakamurella silvestris]|nr:hypothetical protein D1871_14335 [Nakamurella silvestris]